MNDFTGGIFIGDDLQYQQFLKNNPEIKKELDKEKRSNLGKTETTTRISSSDMTPISEDDLNMIASKIADGFRKRGIISDKGDIRLAEADEVQPEFLCNDNSFSIFNFEIYIHNLDLDTDEVIVVG